MAGALSASDIAFEGFRLTRERPLSILVWSGLTFALSLLSAVLMITVAGDAMTALMNAQASESQDPTAAIAAFGQLGPVYALLTPVSLVVYAVLYAAVYRAVLRPSESPGTGDVRLGLDEERQGLVLIAVGLLVFVGYLAVVLVGAILIGILAAATGGGAVSAAVGLVV